MNQRSTVSKSLSFIALVALLSSCTGQVSGPDESSPAGDDSPGLPGDPEPSDDPTDDPGTPPASNPAPLVSFDFEESSESLVNPERGYYVGVNLLSSTSAANARASGHSMAIAEVRLDEFRDGPIDADLIAQLDAGFGRVRASGMKVILRFMYNASFGEDAPRAIILAHIAQLKPLLQKNADVIAVMQAGFIGAWGEWHTSTSGLDNDADRSAILTAILAALPASRSVQVRAPMYKQAFAGAALTAEQAFDGSNRARIGHHNDCFLASSSDFGTYASPVADWQAFVAQESRFTPMGGETCAVSSRTTCAIAVAEMASNHWSYLNEQYHQEVLAGWEAQGCSDEIKRRLGYRFVLQQVAHSQTVAPGGEIALELNVANTGFATPFNRRPVYVVLSNGSVRHAARLDAVDVRRWERGEAIDLAVRLRVPASVPAGTYKLSLWMPDDAAALQDDARYSLQLANAGVWDDATGENVISESLVVDPAAPGSVDPSATKLAELR